VDYERGLQNNSNKSMTYEMKDNGQCVVATEPDTNKVQMYWVASLAGDLDEANAEVAQLAEMAASLATRQTAAAAKVTAIEAVQSFVAAQA
jgi:hypothetical protein